MGLGKSNFYKKEESKKVIIGTDIGFIPEIVVKGVVEKDKLVEVSILPNYIIESSWDDGGALDIKIAGLLKKYNLKGTFYVVFDSIGKNGFLTWEQIKMLEQQGFDIGSHTVSHPSDLKTLYEEQLHFEIQNSKDMIEAALGHSISKFCYPRGRYDDRVKAMVIRAGYTEARTTGKPGITKAEDKFALPGTIHIFQRPEYGEKTLVQFAKETIDKVKKEGSYCNIWGHSSEINKFSLWGVLEEILKYATNTKS